jgi:hypothetical protein
VLPSICIDALSPSIALATSSSVDPNRSPITLMACLIAAVILVIRSSGVMQVLLCRDALLFSTLSSEMQLHWNWMHWRSSRRSAAGGLLTDT